MDELDGWFYCHSCAAYYPPGYYFKEDLVVIVQKIENTGNFNIDDFIVRRIKQSFRYYEIDFPKWLE